MHLMGSVFTVYYQLSKKRTGDFGSIKGTLFIAFIMESYAVYAQFVSTPLMLEGNFDLFLVVKHKLSILLDVMTFVHGLPDHVWLFLNEKAYFPPSTMSESHIER